MLADRFTEELARVQREATTRQGARMARDQVIASQFPLLDAALGTMLTQVLGAHANLSVASTSIVDSFSGRGFATLTRTIRVVTSTLYGTVESVTFTPALEAIDPQQFGIVTIAASVQGDRLAEARTRDASRRFLERGIHMFGDRLGALGMRSATGYAELTASMLEEFLAALFIRRRG